MSEKVIGDLSDRGRVEMRADLLAGSAGYRHFLARMSDVISPAEAGEAAARFRGARRMFWCMLLGFAVAYLAINQLLGPFGLPASSVGNDMLRALLLAAAITLVKWKRLSVAAQLLLPLAALCFLPMPVFAEDNWWRMPLVFGALVITLYAAGWCIDQGSESSRGPLSQILCRAAPAMGIFLFLVLNICAWQWVTDHAVFPVMSVLAGLAALPVLIWMPKEKEGDAAFLYTAAWKRWRFLVVGRSLAVLMGLVPFLLFSNLLDYQKELDLADTRPGMAAEHGSEHGGGEAGTVLRFPFLTDSSHAYYWKEEGRFVREEDLANAEAERGILRKFYLPEPSYIVYTRTHVPPRAHEGGGEKPEGPAESRPAGEHGASKSAASELREVSLPMPPTTSSSAEPGSPFAPGDSHPLYREDGLTQTLQEFAPVYDIEKAIKVLDRATLTRKEFEDVTSQFELVQIKSREDFLHHKADTVDFLSRVVVLTFVPMKQGGKCFVENPRFVSYEPSEIHNLAIRYGTPKWLFFGFGMFGFIFLWRRGGDSSLARWIGIWLVGVSLIPLMNASDDTLPHITHWLWQHSIMYRWNTLSSAAQPLFALLFFATGAAALLWMTQMSPALVWAYICWPTKIYPQYPAIVRQLMIIGKLAAAASVTFLIFGFTVLPFEMFLKPSVTQGRIEFALFYLVMTPTFIVGGLIVRRFTRRHSEAPHLGFWPVAAVVSLNLTIVCYIPSIIFFDSGTPFWLWRYLGMFFGCICLVILGFMILKRDFLRVRAISSLTTMILLLLVPVVMNRLEHYTPLFLVQGPFFGERGAEMVVIMLVMLLFPWMHHALHELLLKISVPALRTIEHRVEHALEEIVDAEDDHERIHMISELFEQLHVKEYVFLSRRPHGMFAVDINTLGKEISPTVEISEPLRKFLGRHHHFIDLRAIAFEWPFFFHQFELHRMTESMGCRFLLPIAVGESVRGLLLLPDGPGGAVVANPAMSENINNLGIAAALNRPGKA